MLEPKYEVVSPLGPATASRLDPNKAMAEFNGGRVGFIWDYLGRGDQMWSVCQKALAERYPDIEFADHEQFGNIHGEDEREVIAALPDLIRAAELDAVIVGVGVCGSCTPAVLRACRVAESVGIPAVALVATGFMRQAKMTVKTLGIGHMPICEYPGSVQSDSVEVMVDKLHESVIPSLFEALEGARLGQDGNLDHDNQDAQDPAPRDIIFGGALDAVMDHFHARLWSDGLPFIPPTTARVDEFLSWTDRHASDVVGVLSPGLREATAWAVAVNGVMAGCRPEYMPLLVAITEAIADPDFRLQDAGSTPGWEPLVVVSGPLVRSLQMNFGVGMLKVGPQSNTSIGRFVRLLTRNVAGFVPGQSDMGAIGSTFNVALAEDDESTASVGWRPLRSELGFATTDTTVTIQSVVAVSPPCYCAGTSAIELIEPLTHMMGTTAGTWAWLGVQFGRFHPLIVMSPLVAKAFANVGWGKEEIQTHLFENAMVEARWMEQYPKHVKGSAVSMSELVKDGIADPGLALSEDPDRPLPVLRRPEWTNIVLGGDPNRNQSRIYINNHSHGVPTTRRVVLPAGWHDRLGSQ